MATSFNKTRPHVLFLTLLCCSCALLASAKPPHVTAPAPMSADCSSALLSLADCLTFVEEGSKEAKPKGQCCPGLKKVVKDQVTCLCQAFNGGADFGVKLNITKALALPSVCGVKAPPFSNCNLGASPGAAPALSPILAPSRSSTIGQSITEAPAPAPAPLQSVAVSVAAPSVCLLLAVAAAVALFSVHL